MSMSNVHNINETVHKTQIWLKDLTDLGHFKNENQSYSILRAVLHTLRDRLTVNEAVHLASQLPMLLRGIYFEGWKPSSVPHKESTANEFRETVRHRFPDGMSIDANHATRCVFQLLSEKISAGELNQIMGMLPPELRELWH